MNQTGNVRVECIRWREFRYDHEFELLISQRATSTSVGTHQRFQILPPFRTAEIEREASREPVLYSNPVYFMCELTGVKPLVDRFVGHVHALIRYAQHAHDIAFCMLGHGYDGGGTP